MRNGSVTSRSLPPVRRLKGGCLRRLWKNSEVRRGSAGFAPGFLVEVEKGFGQELVARGALDDAGGQTVSEKREHRLESRRLHDLVDVAVVDHPRERIGIAGEDFAHPLGPRVEVRLAAGDDRLPDEGPELETFRFGSGRGPGHDRAEEGAEKQKRDEFHWPAPEIRHRVHTILSDFFRQKLRGDLRT